MTKSKSQLAAKKDGRTTDGRRNASEKSEVLFSVSDLMENAQTLIAEQTQTLRALRLKSSDSCRISPLCKELDLAAEKLGEGSGAIRSVAGNQTSLKRAGKAHGKLKQAMKRKLAQEERLDHKKREKSKVLREIEN